MDAPSNQLIAWRAFLSAEGARFSETAGGNVLDFAESGQTASKTGKSILADLSHYGLIRIEGEDAPSFLDTQCSVALGMLSKGDSKLAAWCNAKGRVRSLFRVFSQAQAFYLRLPASMLQQTLQGLQRFVLRSRVTLSDAGANVVRIGIAGAHARHWIGEQLGAAPQPNRTIHANGVLALGIAPESFEFYCLADEAAQTAERLWRSAAKVCDPAGADAWRLQRIRQGLAEVYPQTSEAFLPHWLDLDLTGAVDFDKGCYPGQEVVARMQHRGQTKQRLFRARTTGDIEPGMGLYAGDGDAKRVGTVVDAAPAASQALELLATLRLNAADGPAPYVEDDRANKLADISRVNPDPA